MCSCDANKAYRRATNAAMCHLCPRGVRRPVPDLPGVREVYRCSIGGQLPTTKSIGECPIGRHSNKAMVVRWLGIDWWGVPCPLRIRMWAVTLGQKKPWHLPGCGCSVWLKSRFPGLSKVLGWCGMRSEAIGE